MIISNARIITMDEHRPLARTIGVWHGLIVGLDEELSNCTASTHIDARGAVITPGFYDVHNHMAAFGQRLQEIDASKFDSLEELYSAIKARADSTDDEWITGSGYDQVKLGKHPRREDLDRAAMGKKVMLIHRTSHMLVANTPVFEAVGALSPEYPEISGGEIERAPDGSPTGLVSEQCMTEFRNLRKPVPLKHLVRSLELASQQYASEGLTSVSEAGIGNSSIVGSSPVELAAYQQGHEDGKILVRTQLMIAMENFHKLQTGIGDGFSEGLDLGVRTGLGSEMLSIGPLKMFTDGAISSRTAALTSNFCGHNHAGIMQFGEQELTSIATHAHAAGWQIAMHAIGDEAIDVALKVFENACQPNQQNWRRHRIEHASIVRPDQLERIASLGLIPSPQGQFVYELGENVRDGLGEHRLDWTYRTRSFIDAGLVVPGSSDRPVVSDGAPLAAIQAMVLRLTDKGRGFTPHERISAFEALKTYTVNSAYAAREEHIKGKLSRGYYADFVVMNEDLTAVAPTEIADISVLATYLGGVPTYSDSNNWV